MVCKSLKTKTASRSKRACGALRPGERGKSISGSKWTFQPRSTHFFANACVPFREHFWPATILDMAKKQTPINLSDYAMVYGGQASGVVAAWAHFEASDGLLQIIVPGCQGMIMGTILLLVCLCLIGQPPAIVARIKNGEPIDDIKPEDKRPRK